MRDRGAKICALGTIAVWLAGCAAGGDLTGGGWTDPQGTAGSTVTGSTGGAGTDTGKATDTTGDSTSDAGSTGGTGNEPFCGDGMVEGDEICDGSVPDGATCETEGFAGGLLSCGIDCTMDTANCTMCGNGAIDASEDCDGTEFGSNSTCADLGLGTADELLGCTADCSYDFVACSGCGDGSVTAPEECEPPANMGDPPNLGGATCTSEGFDGGTLECLPGCTFDTAACHVCGDAVQNGSEECDTNDLGTGTCANQGFDGGSLACDGTCSFNTNGCYQCGDNVKNGSEECDNTDLGTGTCVNQGFDGGTLTCGAGCTYNTSACYECGDGVKDATELCDGTDTGSETCVTQGFTGGTLGCSGQCDAFDTGSCTGEGSQSQEVCQTADVAIPDNEPTGASTTLSFPAGTSVIDVNVTQLQISHTWISDLQIELIHGATTVNVLEPSNCDSDNIGTDLPGVTLDDEIAAEGTDQCVGSSLAIPSGSYNPGPGALSTFDGLNPQGDWTLRVIDEQDGDVGVFENWCVLVTYQ